MELDPFFQRLLYLFEDPAAIPWGMPEFNETIAPYAPPDVIEGRTRIPGPHGEIPVRIYTPKGESGPRVGLVWFHGGAFVGGDLDMPESWLASMELAQRANAVVMSVDYRVCNEQVRFPVPQEDGHAALRWFAANAEALGVDPHRIAVGGGSAGACLAAALCVMDRDCGEHLIGRALLIYPVAHSTPQVPSQQLIAALSSLPPGLYFDDDFQRTHNAMLLGGAHTDANRFCFPGDLDDLTRLPPTLVLNCEYDSLRSSGERYAMQLREAGVEVTEHMEPGVLHGHLNRTPADVKGTELSLRVMANFLKAAEA